ncbi:MAG: cupredoxin domain-containing protein [Chloroflexi bacterium]|nr:cupredoxin domain-containing protein [Chloroflexota bacterium]
MTTPTGREPQERLPARREPSEPAPAERFTSPPSTRSFQLSPERAAQIVRQSSNARWVGFLAVIVVVLFTILYYFYELGAPLGLSQPRIVAEEEQQQVVAVERGYNLYQANCARCHGPNGLGPNEPKPPETGGGYIGPTLNDQAKLFQHLNEDYLRNVLEVGGRYVCGNAKSQMPVWADTNGGPLNYRQIEELIAFLRAPKDEEYEVRDPELNEPTGEHFNGWVDPAYQPEAGATPYPDCYLDALGGGGGGASASPAASADPNATTLEVTAANIAFSEDALTAPADEAFNIHFVNEDAGVPHDVDIRAGGETAADNQILTDAGEATYSIAPLEAGEYEFFCSVHPQQMVGTLTVE